jgi:hypothetical protein
MFLHAMTRNIKIHNILDIIQISKFVKLNKCIHENVSYGFSKFDEFKKIKV